MHSVSQIFDMIVVCLEGRPHEGQPKDAFSSKLDGFEQVAEDSTDAYRSINA
jgi:hypothetical protein